jgi:serine/threonine protein phosphatase PrpC
MEDAKAASAWRVIGKSVRGASHNRSGLPNQDAIYWTPESGNELPLILAVSDGHGSNKCFRSDVGSTTAVQTATKVLKELLDGQPDLENLSAIKRTAEERLPQALVREWKSVVEEHLRANPFKDEEWAKLAEKDGPAARATIEADPVLAYGATLLTALVANNFIVYLQLGDGEIVTVSESSEVIQPLPKDERLIANETTSLCGPNAWRDFRFGFEGLGSSPPALIMLSTDGYPNSFQDEQGFLKAGSDFLDMIRSEGLEKVDANLESWLKDASASGSGDDITVGIIKRAEEKDIDSILRRITACETGLRAKDEQKARTEEQGNRLVGVEKALIDAKGESQRIVNQIRKLRWGVIATSVVAAVGVLLASFLWLQSTTKNPPNAGKVKAQITRDPEVNAKNNPGRGKHKE